MKFACVLLFLASLSGGYATHPNRPRFQTMKQPACGLFEVMPGSIAVTPKMYHKVGNFYAIKFQTCHGENQGCEAWFQPREGALHENGVEYTRTEETDTVYFVPCTDDDGTGNCVQFQIKEGNMVDEGNALKRADDTYLVSAQGC